MPQRFDVYDLRDACADVRSVAMVGNAATILERQNGALIDSHDLVIRFQPGAGRGGRGQDRQSDRPAGRQRRQLAAEGAFGDRHRQAASEPIASASGRHRSRVFTGRITAMVSPEPACVAPASRNTISGRLTRNRKGRRRGPRGWRRAPAPCRPQARQRSDPKRAAPRWLPAIGSTLNGLFRTDIVDLCKRRRGLVEHPL
jgi:hypothetical protein